MDRNRNRKATQGPFADVPRKRECKIRCLAEFGAQTTKPKQSALFRARWFDWTAFAPVTSASPGAFYSSTIFFATIVYHAWPRPKLLRQSAPSRPLSNWSRFHGHFFLGWRSLYFRCWQMPFTGLWIKRFSLLFGSAWLWLCVYSVHRISVNSSVNKRLIFLWLFDGQMAVWYWI